MCSFANESLLRGRRVVVNVLLFAQLQNYSSDVGGNFDRHLTLAVHIGHLMRIVFQFREYSPYANKWQVVNVISQKCRIAAAHGRFSHIRQVAPMCTSI